MKTVNGSVEERLATLEQDFQDRKARINKQWAQAKQTEEAAAAKAEEGCCWQIIKVVQYVFGVTIGLYSCFMTFYGLLNSMSGTSDFLHPAVSILCLIGLLTILAFCEGTQIALMLLEKIPAANLRELNVFCKGRVMRTHALAQNNTERYLVGRQIFVTGIVFLIAKLIYMKPEFAAFVGQNLGFLGNPLLINIFVYTGLSGSLVVLAFGQLVPQLIVTTSPVLQYQLFPTYEIIVIQLFCERIGLGYMANILRSFTKWVFDLEDEPFGVGSGVVISAGNTEEAAEDQELSGFVKFWMNIPKWNVIMQYIVGVVVFGGSVALILMNVLGGYSDFTRIQWETSTTAGLCKNATGARQDFNSQAACVGAAHTWVGDKIKPVTDANNNWIPEDGDIPIWIQLAIFIPISNIAMGFLEGSQIAILALEKAPAATIKRVHRSAYFGHKLSQQRDNVRRYLLGRQFLVVFVDFIAAHTMGLGGLGILVPVSQLYPQLLAASNPMWFMGTWGSKTILLLALTMEFLGFCHFSWALFMIFFTFRNMIKNGEQEEEVGSVGQAVDISGGMGDTAGPPAEIDELRTVVIQQQDRINHLMGKLKNEGQPRHLSTGTETPAIN